MSLTTVTRERFAQLMYEEDKRSGEYEDDPPAPDSYKELKSADEVALYEEEAAFYMSELNPTERPDCVIDAMETVV